MKVLHICTMDTPGAGGAVIRLHLELESLGIQSKVLVLHKSSSISNNIVQFKQNNNIFRQICNRLISLELKAYRNSRPQGLGAFSVDRTAYTVGTHPLVKEADIINLHWIANMIDYEEFFRNTQGKPIVWTLHDRNPITGGCHLPGDCRRYETGCGACPNLGSHKLNDLSHKIFRRKEKIYQKHTIHLVVPSKTFFECVKRSVLFKHCHITIIPHGVPLDIFSIRDKQFARNLLSLPGDTTFILCGAFYLPKSKGFDYLREALNLLSQQHKLTKIGLIVFGAYSPIVDYISKETGFSTSYLGYINNELILSCIYSAADVLVIPSSEEAFGLTCLESVACGTPVIAFNNVGGFPEMIKSAETGFLVTQKDTAELTEKIIWMINHPKERKQMGENARRLVEQEYTLEVQAKRYLELYKSILKP